MENSGVFNFAWKETVTVKKTAQVPIRGMNNRPVWHQPTDFCGKVEIRDGKPWIVWNDGHETKIDTVRGRQIIRECKIW